MTSPDEQDVPIRVLLVDDHTIIGEAFAVAFGYAGGIDLVGHAASIATRLSAIAHLCPDVVLLDRRLPDGDGIEAITQFHAGSPSSRILVLTGDTSRAAAARVVELGGAGLLLKTGRLDELVAAIRAVAAGTVGPGGELLSRTFPRAGTPLRTVPVLTSRERDVLTLLGRGIGTAGIAAQLLLSRNTVRNHVQNILTKLGAHSTLKAIALARENGLIE